MKRHRLLPLLLCVFLIAGSISGCGIASAAVTAGAGAASPSGSSEPSLLSSTGRSPRNAASYDDVFNALSDAASRGADGGKNYAAAEDAGVVGKGAPTVPAATAPAPAPGDSAGMSGAAQSPDYSLTNTQVQGVDEGDIVKTDGQYIYVLRQNVLIIFKADGAATSKISSVSLGGENNTGNKPVTGSDGSAPDIGGYVSETASDIYIAGDTAVIVSSYSGYNPYMTRSSADMSGNSSGYKSIKGAETASKPAIAPSQGQQVAKLYIYDITDRSKPVKKAELGQDGYVLTTRLIGTTLYMLSTYSVYSAGEKDDAYTFIPKLYDGGISRLVSPDNIAIMPYFSAAAYTVVCAYDLASAKLSADASLLGGGSTVYMNKDALYIAGSSSDETASAPYTDSVYTVIDYTMSDVTDITCFDLSGGKLALKASGSVPGSLNSQFNLDAYNGNLRVVTTTYSQSWSEYTDKTKGFVNYTYQDTKSANALYVLDASLKIIGSVGDLAPGEQVYSVRFDGDTGYVVTFRQVDPLFAVDLSDPSNPAVKSALKIPGFSEYLHVWSEGRLFGLGMDADAETGRTNGMKLTMFDTTDPTAVSVKSSLKLETDYSSALYNHKAILISAEKGLIAFPADDGYDIYGYSDERGFYKRAAVSSVEWYGDSRGLYIGDYAYIVDSSSISVLDMTRFILLNRFSY